jgi:hypothetical protein
MAVPRVLLGVSAKQSVVLGVAPDPEPDEAIIDLDSEGAVAARTGGPGDADLA